MKILLTTAQAKILLHRLSDSYVMAECLTDEGSPLENRPFEEVMRIAAALAAQCEIIITRRGGKGTLSLDAIDSPKIATEVLRDAVGANPWILWVEDMVNFGEMTRQQALTQRNIMRALERKLKSAGLKDAKFPHTLETS